MNALLRGSTAGFGFPPTMGREGDQSDPFSNRNISVPLTGNIIEDLRYASILYITEL